MSHFTVLVIGENVDEQLAPYDENLEVEGYRDYYREDQLRHQMDAWKRRDEPSGAPINLGEEPLPPLSIDHLPDPSLEELVEFLNDDWGEEWGLDEQGVYRVSTYNPKSKWDWYVVGGRWRGYFKLKAEAMDNAETLAVVGQSSALGNNPPRYDADHTLKKYVDIEGMRDAAGARAAETWDMALAVIGDLPEAMSWRQVLAKYTPEDGGRPDADAAREEYHAQPRVEALLEHDAECRREDRWEDCLLGFGGDVSEYQVTRESYIQDARDAALSTYAVVREGEWYAPGEMGWWGMSSDNEKDRRRFWQEFNKLLDELPDDTLLTIIDAHI